MFWTLTSVSRSLADEDLFFLTIMESYTSENNCSGQWRREGSFPIILFRFLETNICWNQSSYAMNVPLSFIIF